MPRLSKTGIAGLLGVVSLTGAAEANTRYGVFCANERIEVDNRSLRQMVSARGPGTCQLGSFDFYGDALQFAQRNFRGVGGRCSC